MYYASEQTGDVITRWLYDLHMARIWGLPFRIFVCVMGLVVTMLTVTSLVIWWRKRKVRFGHRTHKFLELPETHPDQNLIKRNIYSAK